MTSPFEIARRHMGAALAEGEASGLDTGAVVSALLSTLIEKARETTSAEDLQKQIAFILDNSDPDTDFPFMRP